MLITNNTGVIKNGFLLECSSTMCMPYSIAGICGPILPLESFFGFFMEIRYWDVYNSGPNAKNLKNCSRFWYLKNQKSWIEKIVILIKYPFISILGNNYWRKKLGVINGHRGLSFTKKIKITARATGTNHASI